MRGQRFSLSPKAPRNHLRDAGTLIWGSGDDFSRSGEACFENYNLATSSGDGKIIPGIASAGVGPDEGNHFQLNQAEPGAKPTRDAAADAATSSTFLNPQPKTNRCIERDRGSFCFQRTIPSKKIARFFSKEQSRSHISDG